MTENEMKDLIRSLSDDEVRKLRFLAMYGVDDWDGKTTINGKPFVCPDCSGTGLLQVEEDIAEVWSAEELTLHGDCYTIAKSRMQKVYGDTGQYFECAQCQKYIDSEDLEEMCGVLAR